MGAKTSLLAYSNGPIAPRLRATFEPDPVGAEKLVELVHPGIPRAPIDPDTLDRTWPQDGTAYATSGPGIDIISDRSVADYSPPDLPARLLEAGQGRQLTLHAMNSTIDSLTFAIWDDNHLVRALSLSPDDGVATNIGEPLTFEIPYWAGEHPVSVRPGQDPYPLPFHPLELGEQALRASFGFTLEGRPRPDDIDYLSVALLGYRLDDPEIERRRADYERMAAQAVRQTRRLTPSELADRLNQRRGRS